MKTARPWLSLIVLVGLALAPACSRAAGELPGGELQTRVAQTLTAAPTLPPTQTSPPSATTAPTSTAGPTVAPSATETPTAGPSPTPTGPPLPADDPRQGLNLSAPDVSDDFSTPFKWFAGYSDPSVELALEDGHLRTTDKGTDTLVTWSTSGVTAGNLYVEVTAKIGPCAGKDAAGLGVHIGNSGYDRGYTLEVSCDGNYRIRKFISVDSVPVVLLNWTESDAIKKGPDAENRLGLLVKSGALQAFVNDKVLGTAQDADFVSGNFGLFASAVNTSGLTVLWDDFALWEIFP